MKTLEPGVNLQDSRPSIGMKIAQAVVLRLGDREPSVKATIAVFGIRAVREHKNWFVLDLLAIAVFLSSGKRRRRQDSGRYGGVRLHW